jgi:hypothetical protein
MAENARGSLSSYGEKLCLINFDQRTKVMYPKYSHLPNKHGGLNKRGGLAEYIYFITRKIAWRLGKTPKILFCLTYIVSAEFIILGIYNFAENLVATEFDHDANSRHTLGWNSL